MKADKVRKSANSKSVEHSISPYQEWVFRLLLLLVFLLPIILNPFGYNMFAATRAAFLYVLATIMLGLVLLESLKKGRLTVRKSRLDLLIAAFAILMVISTLNSVHLRTSLFGRIWRYEGLLTWLCYFAVFFAVIYSVRTRKQQVPLLYAVTFSASMISAYAIFQHFRIDLISWAPDQDLTRSISTLGGPTYLGAYLALVLPLALALSVARDCPKNLRIMGCISVVLMTPALLFTFARSAWLAFLVSLLFLLAINLTFILRKKYLALVLVGLLLVSFLVLSSGKLSPYVQRAKSSFNLTRGSSGGIRLLAWRQAIQMIKDKPLLGWGPETFGLIFPRYITVEWEQTVRRDFPTDKAHNDLLQVASTTGLASLLPYVLIFAFFFWDSLRSIKHISDTFQKNLLRGLCAGVLGYLVQLQFNFSVVDITPIFWVFVGMATSISSVALNTGERNLSLSLKISSPARMKFGLAVLTTSVLAVSALALRPILADTHLRHGLEAFQRNGADAAVAELSAAHSLDTKEPYYLQTLGQTYTRLLRTTQDRFYFTRAISTLERAREASPLDGYTYLYLGDAYLAGAEVLKNPAFFARAASNYRRVLALDPNFAQAHLSLGIAYAQMDMTEKAISEWKAVPNLYPAADSAYFNLGIAYEEMGKSAEALENFQKVLELNPSNQMASEAINRLQRRN